MSVPTYLKPAGQATFKDAMVTKFGEVLQVWKGEEINGYGLIGLPLSKPSISHSGASFAPEVMRQVFKNMATYAIEEDLDLSSTSWYDLGDITMHVTNMEESHKRIKDTLFEVMRTSPQLTPIILGGDHSITTSAFEGYARGVGKTVGVIQFDAHHDLRNVQDGGPSNGTPFRRLIEGKSLSPKHLVQIGLRNFSNSAAYTSYAQEKSIRFFTMKDVRNEGILSVVKEAYALLEKEVDLIYLSVDVDVLDQVYAPGCPAVGPGGMDPGSLFDALVYLGSQPLTSAIDIVEIDPKQDVRDLTSRIGVGAFLSFVLGKEKNNQIPS